MPPIKTTVLWNILDPSFSLTLHSSTSTRVAVMPSTVAISVHVNVLDSHTTYTVYVNEELFWAPGAAINPQEFVGVLRERFN